MKFFYWTQHFQQAQDILDTWVSLQNQTWILRASLTALERKLKLHLAVLAKIENLPQPATALQAAINLAAQRDLDLSADDIQTLLFEQGAYSYVFALNKLFDLEKLLKRFFEANSFYYSAEIFNLATEASIVLPDHEVRSALIATDEPAKQIAALMYARQDSRYGLSFFKELYQDLWRVKELNFSESHFLAAALAAGVEQGEAQLEYLQRGLELSPDPQPWVCLMALTGSPEFFPCLKDFAEKYPEPYLSYLSLTGHVTMLDVLLAALKKSYQANAAAEAWFFLTGQQLPLQPNIFLANEKNLHPPTRPNFIFAERYIAERAWEANQRYFFGLPVNEDNLQKIFDRYGGQLSEYISKLLAFIKLTQKNQQS